jgi:hypothetical protein
VAIKNRPKFVAQTVTIIVSIALAVFLITAFIPLVNGGLKINESTSDVTWEVNGLELNTEGGFEITSNLPYDLSNVGIRLLVDADDMNLVMIDETTTIKSNSTAYISLSGSTSLIDVILMVSYYNNDSNDKGIVMPINTDLQGYYLYSMVGVQANVGIEMDLSDEGELDYDFSDPNILFVNTTGVENGSMISDLDQFTATVDGTGISMELVKYGNDFLFSIATSSSEGIVSELKECAEDNHGTITIISTGTDYVLDQDETSTLIGLLESMYGGA